MDQSKVEELAALSENASDSFGTDYAVAITAGGLAELCKSWLALRAEVERLENDLLSEQLRHGGTAKVARAEVERLRALLAECRPWLVMDDSRANSYDAEIPRSNWSEKFTEFIDRIDAALKGTMTNA